MSIAEREEARRATSASSQSAQTIHNKHKKEALSFQLLGLYWVQPTFMAALAAQEAAAIPRMW